jgi:hypothetical protein
LQRADELAFALEGGGFVRAHVPIDPLDAQEEADQLARQAFARARAIAAEASAQISRLADIEHAVAGGAQQIHAGLFRD